ncbi:MAG TPA: ribonuclease P protein component [Candidatus Magasanikbacteria bacterium]|nr:ribonuclease P protein component [Candidatus Magasanikbacteria bacterium]
MLPKENRLTKIRDFNLLFKYGVYISGRLLDLKLLKLAKISDYFPKKEDPQYFKNQLLVGISVGIKISKKAVVRNKIKRQIREILRLSLQKNEIMPGYYLLFIAKKEAVGKENLELEKEVKSLLGKIR